MSDLSKDALGEYLHGYEDGARGSEPKVGAKCRAYPALYAITYMRLVPIAREKGYALALHGSMSRDLDLVAIPWADDAADARELAQAIHDSTGGVPGDDWGSTKLHGRLCFPIHLGGGPYIDLSVMPRQCAPR